MAIYLNAYPSSLIAKALFNFDAFLYQNLKYSGLVTVSVSDSFTAAQYYANPSVVSPEIYTNTVSGNANWTTTQISNISSILSTFSAFANLSFSGITNYSGYNPYQVGSLSNINISLIYRTDLPFSGMSAISTDSVFRYAGSSGDIVVNVYQLGPNNSNNDISFDATSYGFHTLMHEIGHSLGLAHPHASYSAAGSVLTSDFSAISNVGFSALGFHINSAADMNKEYFTVMSYDDQRPSSGVDNFAQTPMILDLIALQEIYGPGIGSTSSGNDTITPGGGGGVGAYRSYFDTGGTDTISLGNYSQGAYLNMGTVIAGATHLVGVSMSRDDGINLISNGADPSSLRWFYGEFENAVGSTASDLIVGNSLANIITGGIGNDTIDGGGGDDTAIFSAAYSNSRLMKTVNGAITISNTIDGTDTLINVEYAQFSDRTISLINIALPTIRPGKDLNGDGKSDILLQSATTGACYVWEQNGLSLLTSTSHGFVGWTPGKDWGVKATGDFNGDGMSDIMLQNAANGACYVWEMTGLNLTPNGTGFVGWTPGKDWQVKATGDFNGDGKSDILKQNANYGACYVWEMNGLNLAANGTGFVGWTPGKDWQVKATGDFNADGKSDILLQNAMNGACYVWEMNGLNLAANGTGFVGWTPGKDWQVKATGDFNGDGMSDILLQNAANGACYVWEMNGLNLAQNGTGFVGWTPGKDWLVNATGDYNGDGMSDILLQNAYDGACYVWEMNGLNLLTNGTGIVGWTPGADWHAVV
jgi:hypothetical protein